MKTDNIRIRDPFVQKLSDGRLLLTCSPMPTGDYVALGAVSDSIKGNWEHKKTLFDKNGGHAMFFDGVDKVYGNTLSRKTAAGERQ